MKRLFLAGLALLALAGTAAAADLPSPAALLQGAGLCAPAVYSWTGFYLGVNGGGGIRNARRGIRPEAFNTSGGLVGGTIGYNYQFDRAVIGAEGDIDWASISGTTTTACPAGCKTSDSLALDRARARSVTRPTDSCRIVTGGAAFGNIQATTAGLTSSTTNAGWTVGAGIEFAITGQLVRQGGISLCQTSANSIAA